MNNLPNNKITKKFVKIGEASVELGVSIDTLRRWEKTGKVEIIKTPGGTRLYSISALKELTKVSPKYKRVAVSTKEQTTVVAAKIKQPAAFVKIGEASEKLGVSIDTLRRWEKTGKVEIIKTPGGTRLYSISTLSDLTKAPVRYQRAELPKPQLSTVEELLSHLEGVPQAQPHLPGEDIFIDERAAEPEELSIYAEAEIPSNPLTPGESKPTPGVFHKSLIVNRFQAFTAFSGVVACLIVTSLILARINNFQSLFTNTNKTAVKTEDFKSQSGVLAAETAGYYLNIKSDVAIEGDLAVGGSVNGLTLTPNADGFTIAGGTSASRKLTVLNGDVTLDQDVSTKASPSFVDLKLTATTKQISMGGAGTLTWTPSGTQLITFPNDTGTVLLDSATQTITNKSLSGSSNTFTNIPNSALTNNKITITAGTGLSGGGDVILGSSITLSAVAVSAAASGVTSISNTDGTLTISPTTGAAIASLNLTNANTWTATQTFSNTTYSALFTGGNIGMGTATPLEVLDVNGRIHLTQATAPATTTDRLYNLAGALYWNGADITSSGALPVGTTGQTLYNSAGTWTATSNLYNNGTNVGIGTTNPLQALEVTGAGYFSSGAYIGANNTNNLISTASTGAGSTQLYIGNLPIVTTTGSGGSLAGAANQVGYFTGTNTLGGSNNFWFDGTSVGIGTTNPAYKLDITTSTASDRGINIANTAATGTNYGIYSSVTGASTANIGGYFAATGATTSRGLEVAALTSATSTGLTIGALSGTTADTGINIGAISGTGATGTGITIGNISTTGTTNYGLQLGTMTGGTTSNYQISTGVLTSAATTTNAQLNLGGVVTTGGTTNYGINVGALSGIGTTNYGVNVNTLTSVGTTNYGLNIGGATGAATTNYGLLIGAVSGASANNYGLYTTSGTTVLNATSGNVGIGTTSPLGLLHVAGQCVTGDTKLKRRKKRSRNKFGMTGGKDPNPDDDEDIMSSSSDGDPEGLLGWWNEQDFEDVRIDEINPGDEILTLDEKTGKFVVSKVKALQDMGIHQTFELVTDSGKSIRTTANHPYLIKQQKTRLSASSLTDTHSDELASDLRTDSLSENNDFVKFGVEVRGIEPPLSNFVDRKPHQSTPTNPLSQTKHEWVKVSQLKPGMEIATIDGWEVIKSIKEFKRKQVFDIEVEGTHNFVGNNIVAHNTAIFGAGEGSTPTTTTLRGAAGAGANVAGANFTFDASNGTGSGGSGALIFRTAPVAGSSSTANTLAEIMRITPGGNVGIGTTGPTTNLQVKGSIIASGLGFSQVTSDYSEGSNIGSSFFTVFGAATGNTYTELRALSSGWNAWNNLILQSGGGNVGIGTTNPASRLNVSLSAAGTGISAPIFIIENTNTSANTENSFAFSHANSAGTQKYSGAMFSSLNVATAGSEEGYLSLWTWKTGSGVTEKMRIDQAGNVGIGTTSPTQLLAVGSSSQFNVTSSGAVTAVGLNSGSGLIQGTGGQTVSGNTTLAATAGNTFAAGNTTGAMTLTSGGTSAWANTSGDLTLSTATSGTLALTSAGVLNLTSALAAGQTTSSAFNFTSSSDLGATDELLQVGDSAGTFMTVLGNGNVGIGTTVPGSPLSVNGGISAGTYSAIAAPANSMIISGNIGIGTTNPSVALSVGEAFKVGIGGTVSAGDWNGNVVGVAYGGTGKSSWTQYGIVYADTTTSLAQVGIGTSGQVLITNGTANGYTWGSAAAGSGDITAVGSMETGAAFADSSADGDWLGLGAAAGRIAFVDGTPDYINLLDANVGIGTTGPTTNLQVKGSIAGSGLGFSQVTSDYIEGGGVGSSFFTVFGAATGNTYTELRALSSSWSAWNNLILQSGGGNVGIGTTSPLQKLDLSTGSSYGIAGTSVLSGTTLGSGVLASSLTSVGILSGGSISANFGAIDTGADNIITTGTMGVAANTAFTGATGVFSTSTTSPLLIGSTSADGTLTFEGNNTTGNTEGNANLIFKVGDSAGTTAMTILNNGNVGIGTTGPGNKLSVYTTTSVDGISIDGNDSPALVLRSSGTIIGYSPAIVTSNGGFFTDSLTGDFAYRSETNRILFGIGSGASMMTVKSTGVNIAGNVGIGTTNPLQKLEVNGAGYFSSGAYIGANNSNNLISSASTGAGSTQLYIGNLPIVTSTGSGGSITGATNQVGYFTGTNTLGGSNNFWFNGTNVGIGTTAPSSLFSVGSTSQFQIGATGLVALPNGSVSAPALGFVNDTATGLYRSGTSLLDFAVGGVRTLSLATAASAVNYLKFTPAAATFGPTISVDGTDDNISLNILPKGSGAINLGSGGGTLYLETDIVNDTSNFAGYVQVSDNFKVGVGSTATAAIINNTSSGPLFDVQQNSTSKLYITNGGNVGIGTTNPLATLQLYKNGENDIFFNNATAGTYHVLMGLTNAGNQIVTGSSANDFVIGNRIGGIKLSADSSAARTDLAITTTGNVGIGTTSPTSPFHILKTNSSGAADYVGSLTDITQSISGAMTAYAYRAIARATHTTGTLSDLQANSTQAYFSGSGGTTTYGEVLTSNATVSTGAIVSNLSMINIFSPTNSGTITNLQGLHLDDMSAGANSNYSIYSAGGTMYHAGNVGIGTTNPVAPLEVKATGTGVIAKFTSNNTSTCTLAGGGTISCTSDINLKKNIEDINYGLADLMQLRPIIYNWKSDSDQTTKNLGFIAQDVEQIIPKLVTTDADTGLKLLNTIGLIPVLTKSIQEQQFVIATLSERSESNGEAISKIKDSFQIDANGKLVIPEAKIDKLVISGDVDLGSNAKFQVGFDSWKVSDISAKFTEMNLKLADQESTASAAINQLADKTKSQVDVLSASIASMSAQIADLQSQIASTSARSTSEESWLRTLSLPPSEVSTSSAQTSSASATPGVSPGSPGVNELNLTPPEILLATNSASLIINRESLIVSDATISGKLTAYDLSVQNNFKSLGESFLGNTTVAGNFTVDGTLSLTGSSLSTLGDLSLQNGPLAGNINIFNGLVTIDKTGKLAVEEITAKTVTTEKLIISTPASTTSGVSPGSPEVNNASIGTATIPTGQTEIPVFTTAVTDKSKIFLTPTTLTGGQAITQGEIVLGSGFVVKLDHTYTADIKFNWWVVDSSD